MAGPLEGGGVRGRPLKKAVTIKFKIGGGGGKALLARLAWSRSKWSADLWKNLGSALMSNKVFDVLSVEATEAVEDSQANEAAEATEATEAATTASSQSFTCLTTTPNSEGAAHRKKI